MKLSLLILYSTFFLLQSCVLTRGVNISQLHTDTHAGPTFGTVVSVDRKFVHTTDIYGRYQRYTVQQWLSNLRHDNFSVDVSDSLKGHFKGVVLSR